MYKFYVSYNIHGGVYVNAFDYDEAVEKVESMEDTSCLQWILLMLRSNND